MADVLVKFCGGCNPQIRRENILLQITELLPNYFRFHTDESQSAGSSVLLLCGCLSACLDCGDSPNYHPKRVIIAGHTVNHHDTAEAEIAAKAAEKLLQMFETAEGTADVVENIL